MPTATPAALSGFQAAIDQLAQSKRGYSTDRGQLSPYVKPAAIDGAGRKLLAIYMVGSDLEENFLAGSSDLVELILGYIALDDFEEVEVVVAFGGARTRGWQGMKIANMFQIIEDYVDFEFGNETGPDAYLYRSDGAHMGDESSLKLFLDFLRDGYVNFDQTFLTFWDHGNSYKGFGNDTNFNRDPLHMDEIARALRNSQIGVFDLIGFDACLMATVEVAKIVAPHAQYLIASEELEPGHGWLWSAVIEAYAEEESIIETGKRMVENFVQDVHQYESTGKTLSLLDLGEYDNLVAALDPVVAGLGEQLFSNQEYVDALVLGETGARSFAISERGDSRASIDLMHFSQLMAEELADTDLGPSLRELVDAIDRFVVHANHDGSRPNSFGIAIDAPENADTRFSAAKINATWLDFQSAYVEYRRTDFEPPVINIEFTDSSGTFAAVKDENLASVSALYGFIQRFENEDGTFEDFFVVVGEERAFPTDVENVYEAFSWNPIWFVVEYDPEKGSAWIPAFYSGQIERDGIEHLLFTAEIDFYQAGKDYSDDDLPYDFATLTLTVHEDDTWDIVDYTIETYKFVFSDPDDDEGTIQFDKATLKIAPGDQIQFWTRGLNLDDAAGDEWFEASEIVTFVQEPVFYFEFLEFEDDFGNLLDYYYAFWAEDATGNATLGELIRSARVVDSPFGNMQVFVDPSGHFQVQIPQWVEGSPEFPGTEIFVASDAAGNGNVSIQVLEDIPFTLTEFADAIASTLLEDGAQDLAINPFIGAQDQSVVLVEWTKGTETFIGLLHLSDDEIATLIVYEFPIGQADFGRELAIYSFGTFIVD